MAISNYEIEFHPEAILEIREAIEWYRERDEAVAIEFKSLLKSAEDLVRRFPESWSEYLLETRGFRFQKFPFVFVYIIRAERIVFVALAHTKRKPGYCANDLSRCCGWNLVLSILISGIANLVHFALPGETQCLIANRQ